MIDDLTEFKAKLFEGLNKFLPAHRLPAELAEANEQWKAHNAKISLDLDSLRAIYPPIIRVDDGN